MEYECDDKKIDGKTQRFVKPTKTNSSTVDSDATALPPIGDSFMLIGTRSNNHVNIVFLFFERTDSFQISNITFYYNRFSILTNDSLKSIQLEFNYCWKIINGVPDIIYLKMIDIVIHQHNGQN